jgi:hypothetical protein
MRHDALISKLTDTCVRVGLSQRNMMYSFRRTGLAKTIREHGTEIVAADSVWYQDYLR